MRTCLFVSFESGTSLSSGELTQLVDLLGAIPHLAKALVHTPAGTSDPYVKDGSGPALVLQLYFAELSDLEATLAHAGTLRPLASRREFPALAQAAIAHQAMLVRRFAVPESEFRTAPGGPYCTYLVSYGGEAEDLNAWHAHYLQHHTSHMARLPGVRELEVYTRLDWVTLMPWARLNFMQRNKVVFDSGEALHRALNSPVRHEMRADFKTFPRFSGPNNHYAMATRVVRTALKSER